MSVPNFRSMHSAVIKTWMSSLAITKVIQFHRGGPWVSFHGKSLQQLRYFSLEQTMLKITLNSVIFVNRSVNTTLSLTLVVAVVVLLISVELLLLYICSIISGPCPWLCYFWPFLHSLGTGWCLCVLIVPGWRVQPLTTFSLLPCPLPELRNKNVKPVRAWGCVLSPCGILQMVVSEKDAAYCFSLN